LFSREEGRLHPTERFEEWLEHGEAAGRRLWDAYVVAEGWNDLERAGAGAARFVGRTVSPVTARSEIVSILKSVPSTAWVLCAEVESLVRRQAADFLREGFDASPSRLVDLQSGEVLAGAASWDKVEAPVVRYLLSGPFFWLGVVEWGRSDEGWDRVRITESGRSWLQQVVDALLAPAEPLTLHEDRRVIATDRADLALLWRLESYLVLERRGPPSIYRMTRSSVARGLEAGGSLVELRKLLERAAAGPLPLSFSLALERWSARAGRFRLHPAVVLSAASERELSQILERPELAPLVKERLGPQAVSLVPARAAEAAEVLERMGQLPEVDAALRLMAGRRAYPALVDQHTLEALIFSLRLLKTIDPELTREFSQAERLLVRLEQALGPIATAGLRRKARTAAGRFRDAARRGRRLPRRSQVVEPTEQVV
jgi:hypothetical protein